MKYGIWFGRRLRVVVVGNTIMAKPDMGIGIVPDAGKYNISGNIIRSSRRKF